MRICITKIKLSLAFCASSLIPSVYFNFLFFIKKPIFIDGFISGAGALIAHGLCPTVTDYLFAGHQSEERGHKIMLDHMGLAPILNLGMRLGEGTGAALAMHIIEAAARVIKEVLTFEQAGVSGKI